MIRKNSLFNVNSFGESRLFPVLLFVIVNVLLLVLYQRSSLEFYGTVEIPNASWSAHSKFHDNNLETRVTLAKRDSDETMTKSLSYEYRLSKLKGGEYIVVGHSKPALIRHNRVFYLDDQCSLIFSNVAVMTTKNVALRCLY